MGNSKTLIQLSNNDNVLVLTADCQLGDVFTFNETKYTIKESITLGHKIALKDINKGEKVIKYNVSIGSAIKDIKIGEHVHLHNMKSDFIPTHTRDN